MTIIVFLVDTSASMNQSAYWGGRPTLLDLAKSAVETFVKIRQRSPESRGDRYMLLSFEEPPLNIKAGWKENLGTFQTELKNLEATCVTQLGASLKNTFDMLNVNRMQTGIDMYGMGRFPYYLEPTMIITITDGGRLYNSKQGVQDELKCLPPSSIPGAELTKDSFRWDQRLFSLVLRLAGTPLLERGDSMVPSDSSPIDSICELTGGRSYAVTSYRTLMQCIDSLVQKVQNGVVIHFEKIGPDPPPTPTEGSLDTESEGKNHNKENSQNCANDVSDGGLKVPPVTNGSSRPQTPTTILSSANTAWHKSRKLIYVQKSAQKGFAMGFWPIPETFWPDPNAPTLPPRTAHPEVKFTCYSAEPMVIENLPFDKYELEPSPLTQYILSRRQSSVCWQVFVANSYKNSEVSHPFGYLKASTNLQCVNLFVMPYNYPVLLPLLEDLFKVHRMKPTKDWKMQFENYLRNMPAYYGAPLRRALVRMNAPAGLVPETSDNSLSYSVINYLRRMKNQAKQEFDKLCAEVGKRSTKTTSNNSIDGIRVLQRRTLLKEVTSHPCMHSKFQHLKDQLSDFSGFMVRTKSDSCNPRQRYRNPFDIPRHCLLEQLTRMRTNFMQPTSQHTRLLGDDQLHSLPVGQMGNYQDYLKRMQQPLREIESTPVRQHMFGNPFKIDKRMMVDEADIDGIAGGSGGNSGGKSKRGQDSGNPARPHKRKPGPLPRDIKIKRPMYSAPPSVEQPVSPATTDDDPVIIEAEPAVPVVVDLTNNSVDFVSEDSDDEVSPVPPVFPNVVDYSEHEFHANTNGYLFELDLPHINHVGENNNNHNNNNHIHARQTNRKLRDHIYREVRRPGKNYSKLLDLLQKIEGPIDLQLGFLEEVKNESLRFKRKKMASVIDNCIMSTRNNR